MNYNLREFIIGLSLILFLCPSVMTQINSDGALQPAVFQPGNISTEAVEYCSALSLSGQEFYFARSNDKWGMGDMKSSIYYSINNDDRWSIPVEVSFSGKYDDKDPHLTSDGRTMYFISRRPSMTNQVSADIWMVEKDEMDKWGTPIRLNNPVNSQGNEYSPCTDNNGNLYFASDRSGGYGQGDLYMAEKVNGEFTVPINLGNSINSDKGEWNLDINGNGKLIIFEASQREQNLSSYGDLYITFKSNNRWTIPQNIKELNTTGSDLHPHLANNESTLFYTSSDSLKSTNTNIYFIEFKTIYDNYKNRSVLLEK